MSFFKKNFIFFFFLFSSFFVFFNTGFAVTEKDCNEKTEVKDRISCLESLLEGTANQRVTLSSEIGRINTTMVLTATKMAKTLGDIAVIEKEVEGLTGKIEMLNSSLDEVSNLLVERIAATYKKGKPDFFELFFSTESFSDFVVRYKYLKVTQIHDRKLLLQMETAKANYDNQKILKEQKQEELEEAKKVLEGQKNLLASQKRDKEYLLQVTQNNEKRFQELLSNARAELVAIKGILAGSGVEMEIGQVSEGQRIATMRVGQSCNSSNTHLHFMVTQGGDTLNPFAFLRGGVSFVNCSGSSCGSGDGDSFSPSGSWIWPLDGEITFTQGYGNTWAVNHTWVGNIYSFHNGIDIVSNSLDVKAVRSGTLYQGVYQGGCDLMYVRVRHSDSDKDTYYLHVSY